MEFKQREIKYRVWDVEPEIMRYELEEIRLDHGNKFSVGYTDMLENYPIGETGDCTSYTDEYIILMQYTGLKDKNREEIWEGDIIKDEYYMATVVYGEYTVMGSIDDTYNFGFHGRIFKWFVYYDESIESIDIYHADQQKVEVIGNIFENPELLDEK
jgi:uncharacterized phage protein (TIGR01671 family)